MTSPLSVLQLRIDELKSAIDALRPISADRINRVMQHLRLEWNFNSNSIEGNTLTLQETRTFLMFGLTANGKPFRDHLEMRGHNEALKKLEEIVHKDLKITENLIKDLHRTILVESSDDGVSEINPGEYKKLPNYLYTPVGERMDFEPPEEVPRLMNELVNWTNNCLYPAALGRKAQRKYEVHPFIVATFFHLRFIRIHPFGDGNGRMARIGTNLVLMLSGYMPLVVRQEDKQEYYRALNQSSTEDVTPLALFFGAALIRSLELMLRGAKGESMEDSENWKQQAREMSNPISLEEKK